MAKQLPSSPSNKKISDLVGMIKRGELILQPEFQRKLVWNYQHKEAFIDTILLGFPFPEIYIAQSGIDVDTLQSQQVVVDGQQRLTTIMQYLEGHNDFGRTITQYKDLPTSEKEDFLNYNVVIRDLQDINVQNIKEVFKRINQTKFNLEQIEIQNAVYDGEFISTGKDILNISSVEELPVFSDKEISRMGDLNFILLAMATFEEGGYFAGNTKTEENIIKYNDVYENKDLIRDIFVDKLYYIKSLDLSYDSIWYRKSNFFTLLMELLWVQNIPDNLKNRLDEFETEVIRNKENNYSDFGTYYSYMYTGTNSRTARVERGRIFKGIVLS